MRATFVDRTARAALVCQLLVGELRVSVVVVVVDFYGAIVAALCDRLAECAAVALLMRMPFGLGSQAIDTVVNLTLWQRQMCDLMLLGLTSADLAANVAALRIHIAVWRWLGVLQDIRVIA